ncbi:MAG: hypothetical protein AAFR21_03590 [Pseudomonadota bacterium]
MKTDAASPIWKPLWDFFKHPLGSATLLILLILFVHKPGYMSPDSFSIFNNADRLDRLNFYHPPIMMWFFAIGKHMTPGSQFGVLVTQTILFVFAVTFLATSLSQRRGRVTGFLWFFALFPPVFMTIGALWKSVWALSLLLIVIGLAARYIYEQKLSYLIYFGVMAFIAGLSRHDMAAPIGVILFWLLLSRLIQKNESFSLRRLAIATAASLGVSLTIFVPYYVSLTSTNDVLAKTSSYPSSVAMLHDIISISITTGDLSLLPPVITEMNDEISVEDLRAGFSARTCMRMLRLNNLPTDTNPYFWRRPEGDEDATEITDAWKNAVTMYPGAFLQSRWGVAQSLWGLDNKVLLPFYFSIFRDAPDIEKADRNINQTFRQYGEFMAYEVKIFHEQWIYMLASVLMFFYFLLLAKGPTRFVGMMTTSTGLIHFMVMSAAACSGDFRYAFLLVGTTLASAFILVADR